MRQGIATCVPDVCEIACPAEIDAPALLGTHSDVVTAVAPLPPHATKFVTPDGKIPSPTTNLVRFDTVFAYPFVSNATRLVTLFWNAFHTMCRAGIFGPRAAAPPLARKWRLQLPESPP